MAVAYEEIGESPKESGTAERFEATRTLKCAWDDRFTLYAEIMPRSIPAGDSPIIIPGASYPWQPVATVETCEIAPFGKMTDSSTATQAVYSYAVLTVKYGTSNAAFGAGSSTLPGAETLVNESIQPFSEFTSMSPKMLTWDAGTDVPIEDTEIPGYLTRGFDWVYERLKMPVIPAYLQDLINKCNDSTIVSAQLGFVFPAETLLFGTPELRRSITTEGATDWSVVMRMSYKPTGWNKFWRSGYTTPQEVYVIGGSASAWKPYVPDDFTVIQA